MASNGRVKYDGGGAFPLVVQEEGCVTQVLRGLTKRELFAAMAMQGLLANDGFLLRNGRNEIAGAAVVAADALLEALK